MATDDERRRTRSPAYPFTDLKDALHYTGLVYAKEDHHPFVPEAAAVHWDYKPTSSAVSQIVSALKQFGLLFSEPGSDSRRRVRLSPLALDLMVHADENDPARVELLKTAALSPKIHREIWDKYGGRLPSDASLRIYLLREREGAPFNKDLVDRFISNLRETIEFAKLGTDDKIPSADGSSSSDEQRVASQGGPSVIDWMNQVMRPNPAKEQHRTTTPGPSTPIPASSQPTVRDLPVTLPSLDIAVLRVRVPMTSADYDALMGALAGMKHALVASDKER